MQGVALKMSRGAEACAMCARAYAVGCEGSGLGCATPLGSPKDAGQDHDKAMVLVVFPLRRPSSNLLQERFPRQAIHTTSFTPI